MDSKLLSRFHYKDYLKNIFRTLIPINKDTMDLISFAKYLDDFPLYFSTRLFKLFACSQTDELEMENFIQVLTLIYFSEDVDFYKLLFEVFDVNGDSILSKEDLETQLYLFFPNEIDEIDKSLVQIFDSKAKLKFSDFFPNINLEKFSIFKKLKALIAYNKNFNDNIIELYNNDINRIIRSTKNIEVQETFDLENEALFNCELVTNITTNKMDFSFKNKFLGKNDGEFDIKYNSVKKENVSRDNCFSTTVCSSKEHNTVILDYENAIYKRKTDKIIKFFVVFSKNNILFFRDKSKRQLLGVHYVKGCHLETIGKTEIDNKSFYAYHIVFKDKKREYLCRNSDEYFKMIEVVKIATDYRDINEHYKIKSLIGKGSHGKVYLSKNKSNKKTVAIKVFEKKDLTKIDSLLILNEIQILKTCKHKNILSYIDNFEDDEYIYILSEFMEGNDLQQFLYNTPNILNEREVKQLIIQISNGLNYLHKLKIVHRDLKPANILLKSFNIDSKVKIADFGLSIIQGPDDIVCNRAGTLNYNAPEVILHQNYDSKIDVWSLGIITFFLFTGEMPFEIKKDREYIIKNIINTDINTKLFLKCNISQEAKAFISGCLNPDVNKRYQICDVLYSNWLKN